VNIPNALTVSRLVAIPMLMALLLLRFPGHDQVAAALFIAFSLTDTVDGQLARRSGTVTDLGKFLDPLADKLLVLAVLIVLVQEGLVAAWIVVVIFSRELIITILRSVGASQGSIIAAAPLGKTWYDSLQAKATKRFSRGLQFTALFTWAIKNDLATFNPAEKLEKLGAGSDGYYTWTEQDVETFEAYWPVGAKPRLAMSIMIYLGVRRSDAVTAPWRRCIRPSCSASCNAPRSNGRASTPARSARSSVAA